MAKKLGSKGNIIGRPEVPTSLKRKGRPVSMSDMEYERALNISKRNEMSFSDQVRYFFDSEEEKMIEKEEE